MTAVGTPCAQPGCGGTIDGGYCNVCGFAEATGSSVAGGPGSATGPGSGRGSASGPGTTGLRPATSGAAGTISGTTAGGTSGGSTMSRGTGSGSGSRRTRSSGRRTTRGSLGAGLIEIPPVPARDPATAVQANPQVPENKRFCGVCERPVGRGRDGRPGLADGYCPHCGTKFSFTPKLVPGELVAGQYEVLGCLAHGGLGWIYLAMDHNLGQRWVVLKGLLNTGDAAAQEAAIAERRFLAEVEHPNIVGVYNFVQHADRHTGEQAGYIVMEYVGGQSLRQILLARRSSGESLPLAMALAYMIEVLPALGYLHSRGLVYCDFKPDNVIQTEEQLKLIDMGGVRRIDDDEGAIYGTVGYQAPEIADVGPSPSSDLYTVGRALAVLTFEFSGYQSNYQHSLPDPAGVPVLAANESFLRVLRRATNQDPAQRFESAADMAEQLTGVLREVLAVGDEQPRPSFSSLFSPELQAVGVPVPSSEERDGQAAQDPQQPPDPADITAGLPIPQVDPADPAAGYLAALGTVEPAQLTAILSAAVAGEQGTPAEVAESPETLFALVRARIVTGDVTNAWHTLSSLPPDAADDWRVSWCRGLASLSAWNAARAKDVFESVCDMLPGELAPKLALAFAAEAAGDLETAARYFRLVWTIDRSYVSAAFGLARTRLRAGDRAGAIAALTSIPATSNHYIAAQIAAARVRVSPPGGNAFVSQDDLREAGLGFSRLTLDPTAVQQITAEVLQAALTRILAREPAGSDQLLGCEMTERSLRFGLESSYRAQANLTSDRRRRTMLVDMANEIRPSTWS
jgi:serine/threonine-protein kinase PknG